MRIVRLFTVLAAIAACAGCTALASCATKPTDDGLVQEYVWNMGGTDYYTVRKFWCTKEDSLYYVKKYEIHYFSKSNEFYSGRTGGELADMVKTAYKIPSKTVADKVVKAEFSIKIRDKDDSEKIRAEYIVPAGLTYEVNYYW